MNTFSPEVGRASAADPLTSPMPSSSLDFRFVKLALRICMLLVAVYGADFARADWKDDIGYTKLVNTLNSFGIAVPNGSGVPISMVEAGGASNRSYWVNTAHSDFGTSGDPLGTAITFIDGSNNANKTVSNHSTNQGRNFFGNSSSVAPGANTVTVYEAGLFMNQQLHAPTGGVPQFLDFRVQNHSWVGSFAVDDNAPTTTELEQDISALRRFDFMINRDNLTALVGLNNNTNPLPRLMTQSYNSIAVGRTDGIHSTGYTNIAAYGPGRSKPDLVAPRDTSSAATSTTSGVATLLHSVVAGTDAKNSEVMKAILMAGATKNEFPTWSRTTTQPLDNKYGAGEVNVYNSYLMTIGGRYAGTNSPETAVGSHGWDYQTILPGSGNELKYKFSIAEGSTAPELSILLTWNVNVSSGFGSQTLANMDLTLTDSLGQIVDQSLSTVDNVEHIYLTNLAAGDYTLSINSDTIRDFGLAWRMSTLFDTPSADFDQDGDVDGRDFLAWQRGFGTLINATHAQGDANGDGTVDADDLMIFHSQFGPLVVDPPMSFYAVPEPGSAMLIGSGIVMFFLARRRCV